jgi:hypothetical protein
VIFVAIQMDSAFDAEANPCVQLWHANLIDTAHGATAGETPVPNGDVGSGFGDIQPTIGGTGTPVIDPATGTLYVVSKSIDATLNFFQWLHALDMSTGNEKITPPKTIAAHGRRVRRRDPCVQSADAASKARACARERRGLHRLGVA